MTRPSEAEGRAARGAWGGKPQQGSGDGVPGVGIHLPFLQGLRARAPGRCS